MHESNSWLSVFKLGSCVNATFPYLILHIILCVIQYVFQSSLNWDHVSMPLPSGHCHFCISYLDISAAALLHIKGRLFDNIGVGEFRFQK